MAKLLLVEDDNNLREIYQARLAAEGYDIVAAQNGEEALVVAKQHRPDLIISDVMMPRISGFEMLDILRNTSELRDTKVIMLTALGQAEDQQRAGKLGADKYLVKSQVTLEDIVQCAQDLLSGKTSSTPLTDPVTAVATTSEPTVATATPDLNRTATMDTTDPATVATPAASALPTPPVTSATSLPTTQEATESPQPSSLDELVAQITGPTSMSSPTVEESPTTVAPNVIAHSPDVLTQDRSVTQQADDSTQNQTTVTAPQVTGVASVSMPDPTSPAQQADDNPINPQDVTAGSGVSAPVITNTDTPGGATQPAIDPIPSSGVASDPLVLDPVQGETDDSARYATSPEPIVATSAADEQAIVAAQIQDFAAQPATFDQTNEVQTSPVVETTSGTGSSIGVPTEPQTQILSNTVTDAAPLNNAIDQLGTAVNNPPEPLLTPSQPPIPNGALPPEFTQQAPTTTEPLAAAEEMPAAPEATNNSFAATNTTPNDQVNVAGKKVIQPINDMHGPDLEGLLAKEAAKEFATPISPNPVVGGGIDPSTSTLPAPTPPVPGKPDPNSIAL